MKIVQVKPFPLIILLTYHFPEEEKKSRRDMYVSNGLDKKIRIEILPARLVQRTGLREHHVEVGAGVLDPALNLGVSIYVYVRMH